MYSFDTVINRYGTGSLKYDSALSCGKPADILPMWVADMDFTMAPPIQQALIHEAQFGVLGYSETDASYDETVVRWYASNFSWAMHADWIVKTPGVVFALNMAIRAFTEIGDAIIIQRPVYYPFFQSILQNGRKVVNNPLVLQDGSYQIDFQDFEAKIIANRVKMFILCSPHNPVGRVWTREELECLGDICMRHHVLIVSDEIHADFVYPGHQHRVFAAIKSEYAQQSIICTSPSKSFNLAGLQISNIFIPNEQLRKKFRYEIQKTGYSQANRMGIIACKAAYQSGKPWLDALRSYLLKNLLFLEDFLSNVPEIRVVRPQGTYLVWLDFRKLHLSEEEEKDLLLNRAKIWLDHGELFGPEGRGFQRINIACPQALLRKALCQLQGALRL